MTIVDFPSGKCHALDFTPPPGSLYQASLKPIRYICRWCRWARKKRKTSASKITSRAIVGEVNQSARADVFAISGKG